VNFSIENTHLVSARQQSRWYIVIIVIVNEHASTGAEDTYTE